MVDLKIGTYPPMCPKSIFLEKQIKPSIESKTIVKTSWERYYTGKYSWHGDSEYSGDTSKISSYAELAKYMYCSAIDYANYLFKYYVTPTGSYSMADFGFSGT